MDSYEGFFLTYVERLAIQFVLDQQQEAIDALVLLQEQIISYVAPVSGGLLIINDQPDKTHANNIKASISLGYGSDINSRIYVSNGSFTSCFNYAINNNGMAVVKSYAGLQGHIATALTYYTNDIQCFMPLGSNDPLVTITLSPDVIPNIVTCGAGDTQNDTAKGNGLEFWGYDSDGNPAIDASSYANGYITGQILKVKETLLCSWWEARYRCRMTASENGVYSSTNGFGFINVLAAIAYNGTIIADPYLG